MEMKREFPDVVSLDKGGPLNSVHALIDDSCMATFQVLNKTQFSTSLVHSNGSIDVKELDVLTEKFGSDYRLCHGVSPEEYELHLLCLESYTVFSVMFFCDCSFNCLICITCF